MLMDESQIIQIESEMDRQLPSFYKHILIKYGWGELEEDHFIYHPQAISDPYRYHFDNPSMLFNKYFPIGYHHLFQQIWLIDMEQGKIASIYHDINPEDYDDEEWLSFNDWQTIYLPFLT